MMQRGGMRDQERKLTSSRWHRAQPHPTPNQPRAEPPAATMGSSASALPLRRLRLQLLLRVLPALCTGLFGSGSEVERE